MLDPHLTDEILALRDAASRIGDPLCRDVACKLSGGWAHVGPCEPCSCGLNHAIEECPKKENDAAHLEMHQ